MTYPRIREESKRKRSLGRKKPKFPYSCGLLFYLNSRSRGRRITGALVCKYPKAFSSEMRRRYSSVRRKSRKKSRKIRLRMQNCGRMTRVSPSTVARKARQIVALQKKRADLIKSRIKICWRMNGDRKSSCNARMAAIMRNILRKIQGIVSKGAQKTQELGDLLAEKIPSRTVLLPNLMTYIDVGIRIPSHENDDPLNVLMNLIAFGATMVNDWQYYLITPVGIGLLSRVINGSKKDRETFIEFLLHAHINGVSPTDVFSFIPQYVNICDGEGYMTTLLNFGSRRLVFTLIQKSGASKLILDQLRNMHRP